jgi:hypothetical protein
MRVLVPSFGAGAIGAGLYVLIARGSLTIDLGIGRRVRPLGPQVLRIDAPREVVFDVIAAPYLGRTPKAMEHKLRVLERGTDAVLAEHFTQVGPLTTSTVETVVFERPARVRFRLVRGPVPYVVEAFDLTATPDGGTELVYTGEIGADLWGLGEWWTSKVARRWEATVERSLADVRTEAERLAHWSR